MAFFDFEGIFKTSENPSALVVINKRAQQWYETTGNVWFITNLIKKKMAGITIHGCTGTSKLMN